MLTTLKHRGPKKKSEGFFTERCFPKKKPHRRCLNEEAHHLQSEIDNFKPNAHEYYMQPFMFHTCDRVVVIDIRTKYRSNSGL